MSTNMEIEQLRKKLLHARGVISELQEELKEQEDVKYHLTTVNIFSCLVLNYFIETT